ncbi:MAG: ATP-grasp domain-containing protein [Bacillota bacterium]
MNVLITSASRKVWLIKAFQQALAEEGGGRVVAVDASPLSAALYFADNSYVTPPGLGDDFLTAIQGICQKHTVSLLIPTRDEELPFFALLRPTFRRMGVTVMVPNPEVVEICRDKRLFIAFCLEHGFLVPETYASAGEIAGFPVFVRERFGKGSKRAFRVEAAPELAHLLPRLKEPIIQQYIEAPEYTVDLCADFSGRVLSVVPRERVSIFGGEAFIGRTCKNFDIMQEAARLAQSLHLIGHNTIQCFWHEGKVKFIEVNPRYGGAANLGFAAGAFTPRTLIRLVLGKEVKTVIGEFEDGYVMLRYTEDLFLGAQEVDQAERFN